MRLRLLAIAFLASAVFLALVNFWLVFGLGQRGHLLWLAMLCMLSGLTLRRIDQRRSRARSI